MRDALSHAWMKTAWDRWAATQTLGDTLEDCYTPFAIRQIKLGVFTGWRTELERRVAEVGRCTEDLSNYEWLMNSDLEEINGGSFL